MITIDTMIIAPTRRERPTTQAMIVWSKYASFIFIVDGRGSPGGTLDRRSLENKMSANYRYESSNMHWLQEDLEEDKLSKYS